MKNRFLILIVLMTVATSVGCVRSYQAPQPGDPHAILKMRRTYEKTAGTQLSEALMLGEARAYTNTIGSEIGAAAQTDAVFVHPVPTDLVFESQFSHQALRRVQEYYTEQVPYQAMESYSCGTGNTYRSCERSVTRYRSESKTRWVDKWETVSDGSCKQAMRFSPKNGSSYLLQYTYQDREICSLSCFEQTSGSNGAIAQTPCGP